MRPGSGCGRLSRSRATAHAPGSAAVVHDLGHRGGARQPGALGAHPRLERGHQRCAALAAHRQAPFGKFAVHLALNVEQRIDALDRLERQRRDRRRALATPLAGRNVGEFVELPPPVRPASRSPTFAQSRRFAKTVLTECIRCERGRRRAPWGKRWTTPACLRAPAAGFECGSARHVIEASGTAAHSVAIFPGAHRFAKQGGVISNLHGEGTAMPTGSGSIGSGAAKAKRK